MDQSDKKELIIALVIFILYIAFIIAQNVCGFNPGSCRTGWFGFGILFIAAAAVLKIKVFG
jgi:hypothetical protein